VTRGRVVGGDSAEVLEPGLRRLREQGAATRHGIRVANVPDHCTDEVADHTRVPRLADLTPGLVGGEPMPELHQPLLSHPRVLVTPHVAFYSTPAKHDLSLFAADNVLRFLGGQSLQYVVNPESSKSLV
jgi:phosphoglycerate dehydrogenase-like enzyme